MAEELNNNTQEQTTEAQKPEQTSPTVEELMAQLAQERAERTKDKLAFDKTAKELGEVKKQLRARQSQQEIEDEAKAAEAEAQRAYVAELEKRTRTYEATDRYLALGMNAELAKKAADAEVNGDMDALASINKQHTDALIKAKEAEWILSRPQANVGEGGSTMSKEEIMAIKDPVERQNAIARNLSLFEKK